MRLRRTLTPGRIGLHRMMTSDPAYIYGLAGGVWCAPRLKFGPQIRAKISTQYF